MKEALVIGFGISGRSAAQFLHSKGIKVTAVDSKQRDLELNPEVQNLMARGILLLSEEQLTDTSRYAYAVCSPGISPEHPLVKKLANSGMKVLSEVELAFKYIKQPVIGISGTNGKTTVTLLVEHILNFAGKKARALGNVGVPLTSAVDTLQEGEIVVAELSSYQLESLQGSLLDASVLLNITPDHLDRYETMEKYAKAKFILQSITKNQSHFYLEEKTKEAYLHLLNRDCTSFGYAGDFSSDLKSLYYKGECLSLLPEALQNHKSHDLENFMAAFALTHAFGVTSDVIRKAYASFVKPHHRIEFIKELNGVKFFDDSKGTNIDATIRAVEVMKGPVHLIAGGVDKGASYDPWNSVFAGNVKRVYAIGQAAKKIQAELLPGLVELHEGLETAVLAAYENASSGDNVLLSPGCSSFDMFKDYVDRGLCFQRIVKEL